MPLNVRPASNNNRRQRLPLRPMGGPAAGSPSPRAPAAKMAKVKGSGLMLAILVWFQLIYMTVPTPVYTLTPPELNAPAAANGTVVNNFQPNPVSRAIKLGMIGIGVFAVVRMASSALVLLKRVNLFFRVFLVLVPLSYVWSISPVDTVGRYVSVLSELGVAFAFCLGAWHPGRFQNTLRPPITILLIGSILLGLTIPDLAIEHGEGTLKDAWHGLTSQKNQFGQLAGFGTILWLHGGLTRQVRAWQSLLGMGLAFTCVLLSRSSTSLMATVFASLFLLVALLSQPGMRRYMRYIVGTLAAAVLTYALAVLNIIPGTSILLQPIAAITGKDMTFSARSIIWDIIKEHIRLNPWLGTGYGAYWIGPVPWSPSYEFMGRMYFYPTESHNGYLEIVNDLGYLGLFCLICFLYHYIRQCLELMRVDRAQAFLFLAMFFQQSIVNLSETTWLAVNSGFVFFVMTMAVVALARELVEIDSGAYARRRFFPGGGR
jgi:exopolysaccharide production protein ExoQ